ncbi:MAG: hypothetical protein ACQKBV_04645 [Puniceicoccales bacterium]
MKIQFIAGILAVAALVLGGCVTTKGTDFDFTAVNSLKLGETTPEQAEKIFGKPKAEKEISNDFNDYLLYQYVFAEIVPGKPNDSNARVMALEFLDGKLNGYTYGSTWENDLGPRNSAARSQVNRQSSTREDVIRLMGQPDGKAYYNTTLNSFEEGSGDEIWLYEQEVRVDGDDTVVDETILVGFDRDGVVDTVTTATTRIN